MLKDITGEKFGRWTVIERGPNSNGKSKFARWWCKCDCGNPELKLVPGARLRNGQSRSCGCLSREVASARQKKYNTYNLDGEFGIGFTFNTDQYGRNEFYFDLEDYDKIKDYCWNFQKPNGYVQARDIENKTQVQMQQIILPVEEGFEADHIHGKDSRNDNRKSNLRVATHSQNLKNLSLSRANTSGVTGVCWVERKGKWVAYITVDGKRKHLGSFINFDEAVNARLNAEYKYFGEWSHTYSQTI